MFLIVFGCLCQRPHGVFRPTPSKCHAILSRVTVKCKKQPLSVYMDHNSPI